MSTSHIRTCSFWSHTAAAMTQGLDMLTVGYRMAILPATLNHADEFLRLAVALEPEPENIYVRSVVFEAFGDLFEDKLKPEDEDRLLGECYGLFEFLRAGGELTDRQVSTKQVLRQIFHRVRMKGAVETYSLGFDVDE